MVKKAGREVTMNDALNWLTTTVASLPSWLVSVVLLVIGFAVGLALFRTIFRVLVRLCSGHALALRLINRGRRPIRLALVTAALAVAAGLAPLTATQTAAVRHLLIILAIVIIAWMVHLALDLWIYMYLRHFRMDTEDNLFARKHVTQTRILQRVANFLIIVVALAWALMTFGPVRQYGVSLLASAGAAGLIAGLALQPVLKNLFAGIQLAITQPIRIDDALLVEGEWGRVEEITSTYVVIKIWDWRRLVLPLSYFIEQPFQNWTRETASLIGSVYIYVDFSMPVDVIRAKAEEIAAASDLWDREVINVAVTDFRERVMEIRVLVSASNSGNAFTLRCDIREQLIAFLQDHHRDALPRMRADILAGGDGPPHEESGY